SWGWKASKPLPLKKLIFYILKNGLGINFPNLLKILSQNRKSKRRLEKEDTLSSKRSMVFSG
ncbi:MAG: hypothetical protein QXW74_05910, partial [Archaeoglobaceae archaeon]